MPENTGAPSAPETTPNPTIAALVGLGIPEARATELATAGATVEALRVLTVDEIARDVLGDPGARWPAANITAKLRALPAVEIAPLTINTTGSDPASAEAIGRGLAAGRRELDPTTLPFPAAWRRFVADETDTPARDRVLSIIGAALPPHAAAQAHPLNPAAKVRRLVVLPGTAPRLLSLVEPDLSARLIEALRGKAFDPGPSFTFTDKRLRVISFDEATRSREFYHPLTGAPLTFVDGKLLSASGVNWSSVMPPLNPDGTRAASAIAAPVPSNPGSSPSGIGGPQDPTGAAPLAVCRAAWLILAQMPVCREMFGDLLGAGELSTLTERQWIKTLATASADDELSDLQDLARAVAYFAEFEPTTLRIAEGLLEVPPASRPFTPRANPSVPARRTTLG